MIDLGAVRPGETIYIPFQTFDSNDPQASVTITGLATTDIEVYKDGSTTQRASDSGYALLDTDGIDFDTTTGIHGLSIDLSDNTTAGFWAAGSQYWVVIASITVDAATINFIPVTFRIGYPDAVINTTVATYSSQTSFTLTSGPAENDALNGCVVCIHDVASKVQLGFSVISDYVGSTKTVTLTAGPSFTFAATDNIAIYPPSNTAWLGATAQTGNDVGQDVNDILTDTADMQPKLGTITDLGSGATLGDNQADMAGGTFSSATDSLEAVRDRGDAAWTTGAGGSSPTTLQNTTIATLASQTSFTLTAGSADDNAYNGMICVVTDSATSTQKAVGKISDYTGSTKTVTLASDPAIFTMAVGDTIDIIAVNDRITLVDTTTTNTDMRGTDSAATATALATAQADLDTITGSDGVTLATAQANYAPSKAGDSMALTAAAVDAVWDEATSGHLTAGSTGLHLAMGAYTLIDTTMTGTPTSTVFTFTGGNTTNGFYNDKEVYIVSGTGATQGGPILSSTYSGGTTTITVDEAFPVTPANGDRFVIRIAHTHPISQIRDSILADSTAFNGADIASILTDTGTAIPGILGTPAGADMSADIAAVKSDTAATLVDTGTTLPGLIGSPSVDLATDIASIQTDTTAIRGAAKKNTAKSNIEVLMLDSTDHVTPKTGLTVTGQRSIDGGAFGAVSGAIAEVGSGIYQFDAAAADMNGDVITFKFSSTGADDSFLTIHTT